MESQPVIWARAKGCPIFINVNPYTGKDSLTIDTGALASSTCCLPDCDTRAVSTLMPGVAAGLTRASCSIIIFDVSTLLLWCWCSQPRKSFLRWQVTVFLALDTLIKWISTWMRPDYEWYSKDVCCDIIAVPGHLNSAEGLNWARACFLSVSKQNAHP